jgi:hypothetical protein
MVLIPALGRKYKNKESVLKDFMDGKDFKDARSLAYCSIHDLKPGDSVEIRYGENNSKCTSYTLLKKDKEEVEEEFDLD